MLRLAKDLLNDQAGFIVSAEMVLISTVGVVGLVTGLTCLRNAVNAELTDVSCAISSLDQSYCYTGFHSYKDKCSCVTKARTAGSSNRPYVEAEAELVPVLDDAVLPTPVHGEGEIISERVIGERIISEKVLEEPVPCEVPETLPALPGAPAPAADAIPCPPKADAPAAVPTPTPAT